MTPEQKDRLTDLILQDGFVVDSVVEYVTTLLRDEREACAEIAKNYSLTFDDNALNEGLRQTFKALFRDFSGQIAAAIRARGNQ